MWKGAYVAIVEKKIDLKRRDQKVKVESGEETEGSTNSARRVIRVGVTYDLTISERRTHYG